MVMAAFLVFLGSPTGVLACQKAMNTAHAESDDMGLSSSDSQFDTEEIAPAYPQGESQWTDEMAPSSSGSDESRDDFNYSFEGTDEHRDHMAPSGTDEWRDETGSSSFGNDNWRRDGPFLFGNRSVR